MLDLFNFKLPSNHYPQDSSNQCNCSMWNFKAEGAVVRFSGSYYVQLKAKRWLTLLGLSLRESALDEEAIKLVG